ncbi:MAG TPA: hypothetical protein PKL83_04725 [bacterium]|nr:hypothetical protein [bacterium]
MAIGDSDCDKEQLREFHEGQVKKALDKLLNNPEEAAQESNRLALVGAIRDLMTANGLQWLRPSGSEEQWQQQFMQIPESSQRILQEAIIINRQMLGIM